MKKREFAERLAKETKIPVEVVADELDSAIHDVLKSRRGTLSRPNALQRLIRQSVTRGTATK